VVVQPDSEPFRETRAEKCEVGKLAYSLGKRILRKVMHATQSSNELGILTLFHRQRNADKAEIAERQQPLHDSA
jgi:hypothetical protein